MMRMRSLDAVALPAREEAIFAPRVAHLMFEGITEPFQEGDTIPVTLHFEQRGDVRVEFLVRWGSGAAASHSGH